MTSEPPAPTGPPLNRLCYGTSTFAAGRLRPGKDSEPGMAALRAAILSGVRLVHSNHRLGTQWAIRRAIEATGAGSEVAHLVKAEAPLGVPEPVVRGIVHTAVRESCSGLAADRLHAVVLEVDVKRQAPELNGDADLVAAFYRAGAAAAAETGAVERVLAYCRLAVHLDPALACARDAGISGIAAQYNAADPWARARLADITAAGLSFVGMSPFARGALVDTGTDRPGERLAALRWALDDPRVDAVVVTMSSPEHFREVAEVTRSHGSSRYISAAPRLLP